MNHRLLRVYGQLHQDPIIRVFEQALRENDLKQKWCLLDRLTGMLLDHSGSKGRLVGWKEYLIERILLDENLFTRSAERATPLEPTLIRLVLQDLNVLQRWFQAEDIPPEYDGYGVFQKVPPKELAQNWAEGSTLARCRQLYRHHARHGTGLFAANEVFKVDGRGELHPVEKYDQVAFSDLIGYQHQIRTLRENVESFLKGTGFNNMLLYGDRGTGKSSSVKALLHAYKKDGLRVIEMKKDQFPYFPTIVSAVRDRRQKCMVFIDDLSFEPSETSYKELKAVLEGSFESKPDNVMMVVTSNRRHLIKENFADRETDIHVRESVGEQLSLFDRFGLIVYFDQPNEHLYRQMVLEIALREGVNLSEEELLGLANQWKVGKGTKSGRSVRQFIDSLRD
jgi:hypothetical protein